MVCRCTEAASLQLFDVEQTETTADSMVMSCASGGTAATTCMRYGGDGMPATAMTADSVTAPAAMTADSMAATTVMAADNHMAATPLAATHPDTAALHNQTGSWCKHTRFQDRVHEFESAVVLRRNEGIEIARRAVMAPADDGMPAPAVMVADSMTAREATLAVLVLKHWEDKLALALGKNLPKKQIDFLYEQVAQAEQHAERFVRMVEAIRSDGLCLV